MKRIAVIFLSIALLVATGCGQEGEIVTITTGGSGGTYYPVGSAIAQSLSDNLEDLSVNSFVGNASVANCRLIGEGSTDLALVQNNVAYWAHEGIGVFLNDEISTIKGIASLYPEAIQIVALKSSNIESVEDLKGKRVSVGVVGSGANFDVDHILSVHNMSVMDFDSLNLTFSEAAIRLKKGEIDAAIVTAGYPTASIMDVNITKEIVIIPIEEDKIQAMIEKYPFYSKAIIPGDTYSGLEEDVVTVTTMAMLVTGDSLDEDTIYDITKSMWEHIDELEGSHENSDQITIESAVEGMGIPLHDGAKRYYREVGIW